MAGVPFVKVVVGGKVAAVDTWSNGFAFKVLTGGTPAAADMNGLAAGAATLYATDFWDATAGPKSQLPSTTDWSFIRTYYYPGGSSVATVSGTHVLTPDPGTASLALPPQVALVASLETGFTGRANRGRVYLPCPANNLLTGRIAGSTVTNWAPLLATFLRHMNAISVGAFTFDACIGTALCPTITTVVINDVADTQRRRRDKLQPLTTAVGTI